MTRIVIYHSQKMGGRRGHHNKRPHTEDDNDAAVPAPEATATTAPTANPSGPTTSSPAIRLKGPEKKRQKREEYRASLDNAGSDLPQKKFYRQRAHANPFSDHALS